MYDTVACALIHPAAMPRPMCTIDNRDYIAVSAHGETSTPYLRAPLVEKLQQLAGKGSHQCHIYAVFGTFTQSENLQE